MNYTDFKDDAEYSDPLVSDRLVRLLQVSIIIPVNCIISSMGVLSNIFNIAIFTRLGFSHSMGLGTMALSTTDLVVSSLQMGSEMCYVLHYALEDSWIDFLALSQIAIGWMRYTGVYISGWITTVIALERCFCVVFPFHVKHLCSKSIYVIVLIAIYSMYVSLVIPVYISEPMIWLPNSKIHNNRTMKYVFTVVINEDAARLEILFDTIGVVGLALFSQIVLLLCTAYMTYSLKASSKIRMSFKVIKLHDAPGNSSALKGSQRASSLSPREKRLVRVAVWLAVIMLLCNIPGYIVIAIFSIMPGMHAASNILLVFFMYDVSDVFANVNCFCNFLVYYLVNTKFRKIFRNFFL